LHEMSMTRSSTGIFAFDAHDWSTENVQTASPLASMWNGEYDCSKVGASMVIGPAAGSSRSDSSVRSVIFTKREGCQRHAPRASGARRRLLLRQAVQRAQAPDEIHRVDPDHLAVREALREHVQRNAIVAVVERRHDHHAVRDVEVRVARREAF